MRERAPIFIGNWKMHKTGKEASAFIAALLPHIPPLQEVMLAVPYTALPAAAEAARSSHLLLGAQNVSDSEEGPLTGEISSRMLWEEGARFVRIGHSERRALFHEDDALINRKMRRAQAEGFLVVLCIGESFEEREEGRMGEVLSRQLREGLKGVSPHRLMVAYEPIWAIGTGQSATPEIAEETHFFCRSELEKIWERTSAMALPLLYGGSVTSSLIASLLEKRHIDGVLVGGASLDPESFIEILTIGSQVARPQ